MPLADNRRELTMKTPAWKKSPVRVSPWIRKVTALVTLSTFLSTLLPVRTSRADDAAAMGVVPIGTGGPSSLAGPPSAARSLQGLATVNPNNGSALANYPFQLPAARGDAQPTLGLTYNSSAGVGFAGVGWTLNLPSIVRKGAAGIPRFNDDVLGSYNGSDLGTDDYLIDGQVLVPIARSDGAFGAMNGEIWPAFTNSQGPWVYFRREVDDGCRYFFNGATWVMQTQSGHLLDFGAPRDNNSSFPKSVDFVDSLTEQALGAPSAAHPGSTVFRWNLTRDTDASGNTVYYVWDEERLLLPQLPATVITSDMQFLTDIYDTLKPGQTATPLNFAHRVHLTWSLTQFPGGFPSSLVPTNGSAIPYQTSPVWAAVPFAQLTQVDVYGSSWGSADRQLVREYDLAYTYNATNTRAFLTSVTEFGDCESLYGPVPEAMWGYPSASAIGCSMLPPTMFNYTGVNVNPSAGNPPVILQETTNSYAFTAGGTFLTGSAKDTGSASQILAFRDMNGDAVADLAWYSAVCCNPGSSVNPNGALPTNVTIQLGPNQPGFAFTPTLNGIQTFSGPTSYDPLLAWHSSIAGDWVSTGVLTFLYSANQNCGWYEADWAEECAPVAGATPEILQLNGPSFLTLGMSGVDASGIASNPALYPLTPSRAMDVDGDGLTDISWAPTAHGSGPSTTYTYQAFFTTRDRSGITHPFGAASATYCPSPSLDPTILASSTSNPTRAAADIDGDALADIVIANKSGTGMLMYDAPNRGDGRFGYYSELSSQSACYVTYGDATSLGPVGQTLSDPVGGDSMDNSLLRFGDLNGDGMTDFAIADGAGLHICLRNGAGIETARFSCVVDPSLVAYQSYNGSPTSFADIEIADVDGSGINQVVYFPMLQSNTSYNDVTPPNPPPQTNVLVSPNGSTQTGARDGLLQSVSNGVGATTTLTYASVASLANGPLPVPAWVVTGLTTTNGAPAPLTVTTSTSYSYAGNIYDPRDRAFVGFQKVTATRSGVDGAPSVTTITTFATDTCATPGNCTSANVDYSYYRAVRGLPVVGEVVSGDLTAPYHHTTTLETYNLQSLYTGADGRNVAVLGHSGTSQFLWDEGQAVTTVNAVPIWDGSKADPRSTPISVAYPTNGTLIYRGEQRNRFNQVTETLDQGAYSLPSWTQKDNTIVQNYTWALPAGDTTGWNYRMTNSSGSDGHADQYTYDYLGRLQVVASLNPGSPALPGPAGTSASRAAPPPPGATPQAIDTSAYNPDVPQGYVLRREYFNDGYGNVYAVMDAGGRCTSITFDPLFQQLPLTTVVADCWGNSASMTTSTVYDRGLGEVTMKVNPMGAKSEWTYDDFGRLLTARQPDPVTIGSTTPAANVGYADAGPVRMVHRQTADGDDQNPTWVQHYLYLDAFGDILESIDQTGSPRSGTTWTVTGMHQRYPSGAVSTLYQPFFTPTPTISWPGTIPVVPSASLGVPQRTFRYDPIGRTISSTDYLGHASTNTYHSAAMSVDVRDAEQAGGSHQGSYTTITEDGHGRVIMTDRHTAANPVGDTVTQVAYYDSGLPSTIAKTSTVGTFPATIKTLMRSMTYDSMGRMLTNSEDNSGTWTYAYDDAGNLVGTSDARGCGKNIIRDALERVVAEDYSRCTTDQTAYSAPQADGAGKLTGDGTEAFYSYHPTTGLLLSTSDRAASTTFGYDARGRLSAASRQMALPKNGAASGSEAPTLLSRYDSNYYTKLITGFSAANRVLTETAGADASVLLMGSNWTTSMSYTYDGRVDSVNSVYGQLITGTRYNSFGPPAFVSYGDVGATAQDYGFDANGSPTEFIVERNAGPGPWVAPSATYQPPAASDPEYAMVQNSLPMVLEYGTPDFVGNTSSVSDYSAASAWPAGAKPTSLSYAYDDNYRLTSVTYNNGSDSFVSPFLAEANAANKRYPQPNAESLRVQSQSFQYDWHGNMISSTDDTANGDFFDRSLPTANYGLEGSGPPDQLQSASSSSASLSTSYDAAGNLTEVALPGVVYDYSWDEVGNLAGAKRTENGVVVADEQYIYNAVGARSNRARVEAPGEPNPGQETYTIGVFDSLELRDASVDPADTTQYQVPPASEHLYLAGGAAHVFYDADGVLPNAGGANGQVHVFMNLGDSRGSTNLVIDRDTGEIVERTAYQAYGALDSDYRPNRWKAWREDYKFGGHFDDSEVGLAYFGARYYSPQLKQFISPDPLTVHGLTGDSNPYAFVGGQPVDKVDPSGLEGDWQFCFIICIGSGGISFGGGGGGGGNSGGGGNGGGGGGNPPARPPPPPPPPPPQAAPGAVAPTGSAGVDPGQGLDWDYPAWQAATGTVLPPGESLSLAAAPVLTLFSPLYGFILPGVLGMSSDSATSREVDITAVPPDSLRAFAMRPGMAAFDSRSGVTYLTTQELEQYKLTVRNGLLYDASGNLFTSTERTIAVMGLDGTLYAGDQSVGAFHHSSFLSGGDVAWAGELRASNGVLEYMNDNSGHYFRPVAGEPPPPPGALGQAASVLEEAGVDMTFVELIEMAR
jgi:RHS repeat-associated protein